MKRLDVEGLDVGTSGNHGSQASGQGECLEETLRDLKRIVAMDDPVLRNLWITQRYHTLSAGIAEVVGTTNVNWSTFATWASKTAGESIRDEEVPGFLLKAWKLKKGFDSVVPRPALKVMQWVGLINAFEDAAVRTVRNVSHEVAVGNRKVFEELAPAFARFIDVMRHARSEENLEAFILSLKEGKVEDGGQDLLRAAFRNYYLASATTDDKLHAQYVLLANCQIGFHEQTRLQENIKGALDAPITTMFSGHLRTSLITLLLKPLLPVVAFFGRPLIHELSNLWEETATRYAMNLSLPHGAKIPLGQNFPERAQNFPEVLMKLDLPELIALLTLFDGRLDSMEESGANNWSDLHDRMGFIVELFRSRQQEADLFGPPFNVGQLESLAAGKVPQGAL